MATKTDTEQEREAFEAWLLTLGLHLGGHERQLMLLAYQAGRAALQSQSMDAEHWAELHRLRAERGPTDGGYATWQQAAAAERRKRIEAEQALQSQDREDAADMFWDADDTEDCLYAYDEETAVERMVENAWPTDFPLRFTLQRAVRLPSVNIKVTSMSECGTDIKYEREAIDHARRIEGDS